MTRPGTCRVCGCTNGRACPGGCSWVESTLCSACVVSRTHPIVMTRSYRRGVPLSVATCSCGWTSTTLAAHYRKQDASVGGHWREAVAQEGAENV